MHHVTPKIKATYLKEKLIKKLCLPNLVKYQKTEKGLRERDEGRVCGSLYFSTGIF